MHFLFGSPFLTLGLNKFMSLTSSVKKGILETFVLTNLFASLVEQRVRLNDELDIVKN